MKKIEHVYRQILFRVFEEHSNSVTQLALSRELGISLSTVNYALKPLRKMNAVNIRQRNLEVTDAKKILYYWASIRNIQRDIIYQTRVNQPVRKTESEMPADIIFGGYSAYKFIFNDVPADYSEVYVYSHNDSEIKKRFPPLNQTPNLIVLRNDGRIKKMTLANLYVDLWNMKEWYAREFLLGMEKRLF